MSDPFAELDQLSTKGNATRFPPSHDPFAQLSPLSNTSSTMQNQPSIGSSTSVGITPMQFQTQDSGMKGVGMNFSTAPFHSTPSGFQGLQPQQLAGNSMQFPTTQGGISGAPQLGSYAPSNLAMGGMTSPNMFISIGFGAPTPPVGNAFAFPPPAASTNKYIMETPPSALSSVQVRTPETVNTNLDMFSSPSVILSPSQYTFDPFSPKASTGATTQNADGGAAASASTPKQLADDPFSTNSSNLQNRIQTKRKTQETARMSLDMSAYASMASNAQPQPRVDAPKQGKNSTQQIDDFGDDFSGFASVRISGNDKKEKPQETFEFNGGSFRNPDDDIDGKESHSSGEWNKKKSKVKLTEPQANEYDCVFESGRKLGVLMEKSEIRMRDDRRKEQAVVKLVVENGSADRAKVTVGSVVVGINGHDVSDESYNDILDMIKTAPRPMTIRFRQLHQEDDTTQGNILTRISNGTFSVGNLTSGNAVWDQKYFAFGGTHADVLQLFESRAAYHECVIALYEKRVIHSVIQSFRLCRDHKVTPIKSKIYKGYGNLYYFALTVPSLHFTAAKFASEDHQVIKTIWTKTCEAIDRKQREY